MVNKQEIIVEPQPEGKMKKHIYTKSPDASYKDLDNHFNKLRQIIYFILTISFGVILSNYFDIKIDFNQLGNSSLATALIGFSCFSMLFFNLFNRK